MLSRYVRPKTSCIENGITISTGAPVLVLQCRQKTSPIIEEVLYYAQELLRLSERRQTFLDEMVTLARPLTEYEVLIAIPSIAETTATSIIGNKRRFVAFSLLT